MSWDSHGHYHTYVGVPKKNIVCIIFLECITLSMYKLLGTTSLATFWKKSNLSWKNIYDYIIARLSAVSFLNCLKWPMVIKVPAHKRAILYNDNYFSKTNSIFFKTLLNLWCPVILYSIFYPIFTLHFCSSPLPTHTPI